MSVCSRGWGVVFGLALFLGPPSSWAQGQSSPSAPTPTGITPDQFVASVRAIELQPLSPAAQAIRPTLLVWSRQSPLVKVTVCVEEGPLMGEDALSNILLSQALLEDAATQIQTPGVAPEDSQLAGLLAMLRVYQGMRLHNPSLSNAYVAGLQRELSQSGVAALLVHTCAGKPLRADRSIPRG